MKRAWTRGEKWLWAAPIFFGVVAVAAKFGPDVARRAMGWPRVLLTSPTNYLRSIELSQDGKFLAASGETGPIDSTSGTIYLWDARTLQPHKPIRTNPGQGGKLTDFVTYGLAFSPNGKLLGAHRHSLGYSLYQMPSARLVWRKGYADYAKFSPDGKRIALGSSGKVTVLNVADGAPIRTWKTSNRSTAPHWGGLSWSPDGKTIACLGPLFHVRRERGNTESGQFIELRRASDGKVLRTIESELTVALNFSPDGQSIVALGQYPSPIISNGIEGDGVRLYKVATGEKVWEVDGRELSKTSGKSEEKHFCDIIFSPDGKQIAALQYQNKSVLLVDAVTGREIRRLQFRSTPTNFYVPPGLAFSPDGKRLFARGKSAVLVWDLE